MDKEISLTIAQPNNFDFLRLLAALSVAIVHAMAHFNANFFCFGDGEKGADWVLSGVPMFFVISGFLVYNSYEKCLWQRSGLWQYAKNRFLRVAPAIYFYMTVVIIFFIAIGYLDGKGINLFWLVSNLILIPVYFPEEFSGFGIGVLNGSLWTIPVEVSFYFLIPFIYRFEERQGIIKMLCLLMTFALIGYAGLWYAYELGCEEVLWVKLYNITFIPHLTYFSLGICLLRIWKLIPEKKSGVIFWCCVSVLILQYFIKVDAIFLGEFFYGIPLSYVTIYLAFKLPSILSKFTKKLGDLSYGVYIWHMPIINVFIYYGLDKQIKSGTLLIILALFTTVLIAAVSWWIIERPLLKLKRYSIRRV